MIIQFVAGMVSCVGFAYLFNCPKKAILSAAFAGGCGWITYAYAVNNLAQHAIAATLYGTLVLAAICELLAHLRKDAVTIFIIPAILPLVPGAGLYYTLRYLIEGELSLALDKGLVTIGCALAIAIGIIIVSSVFRLLFMLKRRRTYHEK